MSEGEGPEQPRQPEEKKEETPEQAAARWRSEVGGLFDAVSRGEVGLKPVGSVRVRAENAARILAGTGHDVTGFLFMMTPDAIRHIVRTHGSPRETLRGQVPIVRDDFLGVIDALIAPDAVRTDGPTRQGVGTVFFTKAINGFDLFCIAEVRTGRHILAPVTLYKRRQKAQPEVFVRASIFHRNPHKSLETYRFP